MNNFNIFNYLNTSTYLLNYLKSQKVIIDRVYTSYKFYVKDREDKDVAFIYDDSAIQMFIVGTFNEATLNRLNEFERANENEWIQYVREDYTQDSTVFIIRQVSTNVRDLRDFCELI